MSDGTSTDVFGSVYSAAYEALYREKNYAAECDFIEGAFRHAGVRPVSILDLGCGSGGHAIPLAQRGYQVVGVDRSPNMLRIARKHAQDADVDVEFQEADIRSLPMSGTFDAVISMFAVMSYQTDNEDLAQACSTAYRHLRPGGIFVFDAWHGPGVLTDRPSERMKVVLDGTRRIVRFTSPALDPLHHTVETRFTLWLIEDGHVREELQESHTMRFFFPLEISYFLTIAGFSRVELYPFMQLDRALSLSDWQMTVVATR